MRAAATAAAAPTAANVNAPPHGVDRFTTGSPSGTRWRTLNASTCLRHVPAQLQQKEAASAASGNKHTITATTMAASVCASPVLSAVDGGGEPADSIMISDAS